MIGGDPSAPEEGTPGSALYLGVGCPSWCSMRGTPGSALYLGVGCPSWCSMRGTQRESALPKTSSSACRPLHYEDRDLLGIITFRLGRKTGTRSMFHDALPIAICETEVKLCFRVPTLRILDQRLNILGECRAGQSGQQEDDQREAEEWKDSTHRPPGEGNRRHRGLYREWSRMGEIGIGHLRIPNDGPP